MRLDGKVAVITGAESGFGSRRNFPVFRRRQFLHRRLPGGRWRSLYLTLLPNDKFTFADPVFGKHIIDTCRCLCSQ